MGTLGKDLEKDGNIWDNLWGVGSILMSNNNNISVLLLSV